MFERFTDNARKVMANASTLARDEKSPFIRRHHMLVGLLDDAIERPEGVPALMLADAAVDLASFRDAVLQSLRASETPSDEVGFKQPFSGGGKKALELALREALSLGHNYIGCEHMLLSILRTADGPLSMTILTTDLRYGSAREFLRTYAPGRTRRRFRSGPGGVVYGGERFTRGADEVLTRAARRAGADRALNTGDFLVALSELRGTHAERILGAFPEDLVAKADALVVDGVADGEPDPVRVDPRSGAMTVTDPALAAKLKALSPDKLAEALRRAVGE